MFLALRYAKNMTDNGFKVTKTVIAILVTVLEILKISIRIYKGEHCDSYMPLYFCSLFIFAIWLTFSKNKAIKNCGYSYITMGGALASVTYLFYPSTSLPLFPIWHPSTLHSFWYHWTMLFLGLIVLKRKEYIPCAKDSVKFFIFIVAACIPSVIINERFGTNCMFLGNPFNLPILDGILQYSKVLYIAVAVFGQAVAIYWASLGLYKLFIKLLNRRETTK